MVKLPWHQTRAAADAAARRAMRKIHGKQFQPKAGVDFYVSKYTTEYGWVFRIIDEAAHRRDAAENARAQPTQGNAARS